MSLEKALAACFERADNNQFFYVIPVDFPAFEGNFPGNPLLPGVCQLGLCCDALSRMLGKRVELRSVSRCKFIAPIRPGQKVKITLTPRPDGQTGAELIDPQTGARNCQLIFSGRNV